MEMAWRTEPVDVWLWASQYLQRRYGNSAALLTDAWYHLVNSVYKYGYNLNAKSFIERAPYLVMPRCEEGWVVWEGGEEGGVTGRGG